MVKGNRDEPCGIDRFADSPEALHGIAWALATAISVSREQDDALDLQHGLENLRARVHRRVESLEAGTAHSEAGQRQDPDQSARGKQPPRVVPLLEPPEGTCFRVRAHVERHPDAVNSDEGKDSRVVVFLEGGDKHGGALLVRDILGEYDPTEVPDVLKRLVSLDSSDDAEIVRFYEEFGPLGYPWLGSSHPDRATLLRLRGEPVWWLKRMAEELRTILQAYHALQSGETSELRRLFAFVPRSTRKTDLGRVWLAGNDPLVWVGSRYYMGDGSELPPTERRRPTKKESLLLADRLIKTHVDLMLGSVRRVLGSHEREQTTRRQSGAGPRSFLPCWRFSCLLDALYLQVYEILCSKGKVGVCRDCGRPFPLSGTRRGTVPRYCRDRCRWRANKQEQRRSHSRSPGIQRC